jgi:hypothetical protein
VASPEKLIHAKLQSDSFSTKKVIAKKRKHLRSYYIWNIHFRSNVSSVRNKKHYLLYVWPSPTVTKQSVCFYLVYKKIALINMIQTWYIHDVCDMVKIICVSNIIYISRKFKNLRQIYDFTVPGSSGTEIWTFGGET